MNFDEFNWMQTSKVGAWGLEGCPNLVMYLEQNVVETPSITILIDTTCTKTDWLGSGGGVSSCDDPPGRRSMWQPSDLRHIVSVWRTQGGEHTESQPWMPSMKAAA